MRLFFLTFVILSCWITSCQDNKSPKQNIQTKPEVQKKEVTPLKPKYTKRITNKNVIEILTEYGNKNKERFVKLSTDFGEIEIELYNETPLHRANFIQLVKRKFLNETCFYRVAKGFVIQGGNSDRMEMAKIKRRIGQFTIPHEIKKKLKHHYGCVAMARVYKNNPNKRSSPFEFYIDVDPKGSHHLDGEHTVIGRVIKGMDVAKKINLVEVDFSEWPRKDVYMKATIIK
ncbi:peptidylprolyl isomerase [Aquimarina agarilytica]|uniref:peptidylprolyl isomerase n=1 Tax=Aquimarina agarilytica TaxID=1087449 RepID=UPI0002890CE5|nr:peptidylprolyl isomerase [Aquimarina agarilytica]